MAGPKIEWNVPRDQRVAQQRRGAAGRRQKKKIQWEAKPADRGDTRPERKKPRAHWESDAARLQGGNAALPTYREVTGLAPELVQKLVPGTLMFLAEHVEVDGWDGKNWPVPLVSRHHERNWDKKYDLKSCCLLPKGGMVLYVGCETVDAQRGSHRNVRMDIHKFVVRDGIYAIMDLDLVRLPE